MKCSSQRNGARPKSKQEEKKKKQQKMGSTRENGIPKQTRYCFLSHMLSFEQGDMMRAKADALVNAVNAVGVMGKGIALQFKKAFPQNNKEYIDTCKNKELVPGKLLCVWDENLILGRKLIINFPTKVHWRYPSKYEYIEKGLGALKDLIKEKNIKSLAMPPLGCGNGGLDWEVVKKLIEKYLGDSEANILVYSDRI